MQKQGRLIIVGVIVVLVVIGLGVGLRLSSTPAEEASPQDTPASVQATPVPVDLEAIQAQIDTGDFAGAQAALEQVVAAHPEDAEAYFMLGLTYFNLQAFDEAREAFARSMALDPERSAAVHHNLGVLAYQIGDMETAVEEFETALEADPDDPDSHYQLGATYLQMASSAQDVSLWTKAEDEFKQVLALDPKKPEALVGLGTLYASQQKFDAALELLEQAVAENPEMREALFALGLTYLQTGQTDSAKEMLQDFLDTDPPARWAQQAQDALDQITP